jgi:hypothetical protein
MQSHSGVSDYEPLAGRRSAALTRCCRLSAPRRRPRVPLRIVTTDGLRRLDRLQYIEDHSHYLDQLVGLKWVQLINATSGTPSKIDENGSATTSSAPSHTKILSKRPSLKAVDEARVKIVTKV